MYKKILMSCILIGMSLICTGSLDDNSKAKKHTLKRYSVMTGGNSHDNSSEDCFDDEDIFVCDDEEIEKADKDSKYAYKEDKKGSMPVSLEFIDKNYNTNYGYKDLEKRSNGGERQKFYKELKKVAENFYYYEQNAEKIDVESDAGNVDFYSIAWIELNKKSGNSTEKYNLSEMEAVQTYYMLRNDCPYFYFLSNEILVSDNYLCIITDKEYATYKARKNYYNKIEEKIKEYKTLLDKCSNNYEKELIIHDKMIMDIDYAYESMETSNSHNIVGVFDVSVGEAVCEGYAKACQLLLNYVKVNNVYVTGKAENYEHAWNVVQMDNNLYYGTDITWDDVPEDIAGGISYDYFNNNSSRFTRSHKASTSYAEDEYFLYDVPSITENNNYTYEAVNGREQTKNLTSNGIKYEIKGLYATLTEYEGKANSVDIPAVVGNKIVRKIGKGAFLNNDNLISVTIPDTVSIIENTNSKEYGSFAECDNLANVKCADNLNYIGRGTFYNCPKLTSINVPKRLKNIYYSAMQTNESSKISNTFVNKALENNVNIRGDIRFRSCQDKLKISEKGNALLDGIVLYYKSTNSNVADIDTNGNITPKKVGKTLIVGCIDGNYYATKTLSIEKDDISNFKVSDLKNEVEYTGSKIEQNNIKIYSTNNNLLKKNVDYTINYSNNVNVGKATIKITGKGSYKGTITKTFYIVPSKVKGLKLKSSGKNYLQLQWNGIKGVSGYKIERYNDNIKKYVLLKTTTATSYKNTNLQAAYIYTYRVRAYKDSYMGKYSNTIKLSTKPSVPTNLKLTTSNKVINISFKKVDKTLSGHEIYRATSKNGTYKNIKTLTGNIVKYKNSNLQRNKYYYYKVRAYKTLDGKKIYSGFSSIKYIKCK